MTLLTRSVWICHMPEASNDASSTDGSPVLARRKSAVPIAPAIVSPPTTSPNAGRGPAGHSSPGRVKICCIPLRAQYAPASYPPRPASGPLGPNAVPRT